MTQCKAESTICATVLHARVRKQTEEAGARILSTPPAAATVGELLAESKRLLQFLRGIDRG
jgi:hypothetical protein